MDAQAAGLLEYLGLPAAADTGLATLSGPVRDWFQRHHQAPTAAQRLAWPSIAAKKSLLLQAPTGGGKTLAAFLPILDQLCSEPTSCGLRCLYVAPLKALCNDVRKNLRRTLRGLQLEDVSERRLRIGLRTGDTSARMRRVLLRRPPDILLTTPETLAVLLTQPSSNEYFRDLRWLVVDEIHALFGTKRGADLAISLERLTRIAGEKVQRIGLSATCPGLGESAHFLVGTSRTCTLARAGDTAPLDLTIEPLPDDGRFMTKLLDRLEPELRLNRTTLVFANVRNLTERLAWALRRRFPEWIDQIAVHHSALAAARRRLVERRLKLGRLRVVVSSTSLELGIDIGSVDGVVLVHPPGGVARLLQRVGRSGHQPGQPRRGLVITASAAELLEAAVTAGSGRSGQFETPRRFSGPLDVLCQHLLVMACQDYWLPDDAFALVRRAYPFCDLPREDFDDCLDYLSGRGKAGPDWLPSRLHWLDGRFAIRDRRTAQLVRMNLGTIIAEEAKSVRLADAGEIGQVDESYADRLHPGDRFLLDGRCLELRRSAGAALEVEEVIGRPMVPSWAGFGLPLSADLARRLYALRIEAAEALRDSPAALVALLRGDHGLGEAAAHKLADFFHAQECFSEIPDTQTLLVEEVRHEDAAGYYLHVPLNRAATDVLARLAARRLARRIGGPISTLAADLGFALVLPGFAAVTAEEWRALLSAANFAEDRSEILRESGLLRDRFGRVAQTGFMLLRNPLGARRRVGGRDWAQRRLFEQVRAADPEFVLLRQAEREVREQCWDADAAQAFLDALPGWEVRVRSLSRISPFAETWTQTDSAGVAGVPGPEEALRQLHALLTGAHDLAQAV